MTKDDVALSVDAPKHHGMGQASAHNPMSAMASRRPKTVADAEVVRGSEATRAAADTTTSKPKPDPAPKKSAGNASAAKPAPTTAARKRTSKRS